MKIIFFPALLPSKILSKMKLHRIVGVGRDLCGSSSPTPLPKQGHPEQVAQDLIQVGLEYLQRRGIPQPPWAACSSAL